MNKEYAQRNRDAIMLMKLAEVAIPTSYDKVMLGALMMRYPVGDFQGDIQIVVRSWRLTPMELFHQCKQIWATGFRPEDLQGEGSAWDAEPGE